MCGGGSCNPNNPCCDEDNPSCDYYRGVTEEEDIDMKYMDYKEPL